MPNIPTAVIVIAAAALLIFVLLDSSLTVHFEYDQGFKFKIKYLFFTIMMNPDSPRRIKKKARKEAKKKKKEAKKRLKQEKKELKQEKKESKTAMYQRPQPAAADAAKKKRGAAEAEEPIKIQYKKGVKGKPKKESKPKSKKKKISLDLIMAVIRRASPHVKRIFKKIRFYDLYIDIIVGGEDAAKTAISYGIHCSVINSIAAFLSNTVTFEAKKISINADFDLEKTDYCAKGTVKLRLSTLLHSAVWGGLGVLKEILEAGDDESEEKTADKGSKKAA
ncbi:MAG: DUF2953 domain-containing protein [Firmicutes bacterium]|nr:DUF2953 domain-containing protein [[Eubacterium] siraeum]MCM1487290.1 DUF2953 domain-containing protein [Bacillota bacterium]